MYVRAQGLFIGFIIISELFLVLFLILYCGGFKRRGKKKENKQQNTPTELPDAFFKISLIQIIITDCLGE